MFAAQPECEINEGSTSARVEHYLARLDDRSCVRRYGHGHPWYVAAEELGRIGEPAIPGLVGKLSTRNPYELKLALYALMLASQAPSAMQKTNGDYLRLGVVLSEEHNEQNRALALAWWKRHAEQFRR